MKLDLRPILRGETDKIELDISLEPESPLGVEFAGQARLVGAVVGNGINSGSAGVGGECGYMNLSATAEVEYKGQCARCLSDVGGTFSIPFERVVVTKGTLTDREEEENVDEYVVTDNGVLDGDELCDLVREAILLDFPMRLLCDDYCAGLCPVCGKRRSDGECGCNTKTVDPRWAKLASIRFDEDGNMIAPEKKK